MVEVPQSETVTLRIPAHVLSEIDRISGATERSRSYIILRALKGYLLQEGADVLAAIEGRSELDAGEHEDIDVVLADIDRIITG